MAGCGGGKPSGYVSKKKEVYTMPNYGDPHYETFPELFNAYLSYAYDVNYPPRVVKHSDGKRECVSFHKLTLTSDGKGTYKQEQFTFEPHLWYKIKKQVELLSPDPIEEVLYGDSDADTDS